MPIGRAGKTALALLSGGRDSFLAVCLCVEAGYRVIPAVCDNGHTEGIDRVGFVVTNLQRRYGRDRVENPVLFHTAMTLQAYLMPIWHGTPADLAARYPDMPLYQAHCLACKSAMYAHAIAFCRAASVGYLIDGMRESQGFFVDLPEMHGRFSSLCVENGVELLTPVCDLMSDLKRKRMLCDSGLPTKTLEPQCFLGCPLHGGLSDVVRGSLAAFFDDEILAVVRADIPDLAASKAAVL